jgi:hypothetical protein
MPDFARARQRMVDATPLARIGKPEEMAELAGITWAGVSR